MEACCSEMRAGNMALKSKLMPGLPPALSGGE
jgi:hypothetical protein